jgi:hypothetical protein
VYAVLRSVDSLGKPPIPDPMNYLRVVVHDDYAGDARFCRWNDSSEAEDVHQIRFVVSYEGVGGFALAVDLESVIANAHQYYYYHRS